MVFHQDVAAGIEGVEHHGSSVAEPDLEYRMVVLTPPSLARGRMILAELEQMHADGHRPRDFGNAVDAFDVRKCGQLRQCVVSMALSDQWTIARTQ